MPALETLGDRIQYARLERGQSVADLARPIGVVEAALKVWESGKSRPRSNRLPVIANALSVSMRWLMSGEGTPWAELAKPTVPVVTDADVLEEVQALRRGVEASIARMADLELRLKKLLLSGRGSWDDPDEV